MRIRSKHESKTEQNNGQINCDCWVRFYCERVACKPETDRCICSAGVIGLDVALLLAERGYGSHITVVAEHLPGDTSINYTSPWYVAGSPDILVLEPEH